MLGVWNIVPVLLLQAYLVCTSSGQKIQSKLDEGWWAYKDVVQGSFIPGRTTVLLLLLFGSVVFSLCFDCILWYFGLFGLTPTLYCTDVQFVYYKCTRVMNDLVCSGFTR
ncbi:hypothetical protein NL108_013103 [Boleophthalmus pectinirostris]|nr:hypothetical protein NL108_013103 [Boleophthalmus pectinirostris]